jgi:hypothetical protein
MAHRKLKFVNEVGLLNLSQVVILNNIYIGQLTLKMQSDSLL